MISDPTIDMHLRDLNIIIAKYERKIEETAAIMNCLNLIRLENGQKKTDPQTGEQLTDARRQELYTLWIAKADTLITAESPTPAEEDDESQS